MKTKSNKASCPQPSSAGKFQHHNMLSKRLTFGTQPKENDGGQGGKLTYPWRDGERPVTVGIQDLEEGDVVIAVMGPTGSGKSTFVRSASGQGPEGPGVGDGLKSHTSDIRTTRFWDQENRQSVVLVDTPGFNDTYRSDVDILNMISEWLESSYKRKKLLSGIFYLHRITDNRVAGTSLKNLQVFRKLCGADALAKVYLTATMWDEVEESISKNRLEELKSQYWRKMINHGARVVHCEHVDETPKQLIQNILVREGSCRLLLQEEMVELNKTVRETSAGMELYWQLDDFVRAQMATLERLEDARGQALDPVLVSELQRECVELRAKVEGKYHEMQELKLPWTKRFFSEPFKVLRFLAFQIRPPRSQGPVPSAGLDPDLPLESNFQFSSEVKELTKPQYSDPLVDSHLGPNLTALITKKSDHQIANGGFGDIYKCWYTSGSSSKEVAVKALRFQLAIDGRPHKMLRREFGIWRRLDHKNVVPFLGIAYGFGMQGVVSLVSLWMPNGSLQDFLANYDDNLGTGHRLQLLLDTANGLHHRESLSSIVMKGLYPQQSKVHSQENPIVHGDLTSTNILIDADYTARLTDFGFASVLGGTQEYLQRSTRNPGALRFIAPEQVDPDYFERTTKSDVFSFGCVTLQVLSGKRPWSEVQRDVTIIVHLSKGIKPSRPKSRAIDDLHWDLIQRCWSSVDERPPAEVIISDIKRSVRNCLPFPALCELVLSWPRQAEYDVGGF